MRRIAVSVATGRVAAVFLEDGQLVGWCRSAKAFSCPKVARRIVGNWVDGFGPDHLILEDAVSLARKGQQSQTITRAIAKVFGEAEGLDMRVRRAQGAANKFEEAALLVARYPSARSLLPERPPIWLPEPRNMSYFEALALVAAIEGSD